MEENEHYKLVGGSATPLKNMKVNWDDEIPNIWENEKWQPNHQPVNNCAQYLKLQFQLSVDKR